MNRSKEARRRQRQAAAQKAQQRAKGTTGSIGAKNQSAQASTRDISAAESKPATGARDPKTGFEIAFWIVGFLDLMGYSKVLESLDSRELDWGELSQPKYAAAYERAYRIRTRFHSFLTLKSEDFPTSDYAWPTGVGSEIKEMVTKSRKMRVIQSPGADHMVLALSMAPSEEHFPPRAFVAMLTTISVSMLMQLAIGADEPDNGLPVRGGLDIARGGRIGGDGFLYSPAMARAYAIENTQAIYPRVVVGERILEMLHSQIHDPVTTTDDQMIKGLATQANGMFFKCADGLFALDFFGSEMFELLRDNSAARGMAEKAWRASLAAERRYRDQGDYRTATKYAWLVDYMRPRLPVWSINS